MSAQELIERLRVHLGPPFSNYHLTVALREAAVQVTRLTLHETRAALLVLNMLSGEQLLRRYKPVESAADVRELFTTHVPQPIFANGAQAVALAFVTADLHLPLTFDRCAELMIPACADDQLLEWCGPGRGAYAYVIAADSTGRALIARAPVVGTLTGTFKVEADLERLSPALPILITGALRMSAMYCWPN